MGRRSSSFMMHTKRLFFFQEHARELRVFHVKIERGFKYKKLHRNSDHRRSSSNTSTRASVQPQWTLIVEYSKTSCIHQSQLQKREIKNVYLGGTELFENVFLGAPIW